MEKISLIITVKNEEKTIKKLLSSIEVQSRKPDEVVIVDGGSEDRTMKILNSWKPDFSITILQYKGNRSIGRNKAIRSAVHKLIAICDAGSTLDKKWLAYISSPFADKKVDVVAGYYQTTARSAFERAASAYMLVLPKNFHEKTFLPASRSMALRKNVWESMGGFPEKFTYSEDFWFSRKLRNIHANIYVERKAVVYWDPPSSWSDFLVQIFKFASGDTFAGIIRPKVLLVFLRYIVLFMLFKFHMHVFFFFFLLYLAYAVYKHGAYIHSWKALYILPFMQITVDVVVMAGTFIGVIQKYAD